MAAKHPEITDKIIRAFYTVYNTLGYGFPEKVYQNAMVVELHRLGMKVQKEVSIQVYYQGECVGAFFADLVVEDVVVVELKAAQELIDQHEAQLLSYLKSCIIEVGLLINFGPKLQIQRKIYDNALKGDLSWASATKE